MEPMIQNKVSNVTEAEELLKSLQQARTTAWRWSGETRLVTEAGALIFDFADPSALLESCDGDLIKAAPDLLRLLDAVVEDYHVCSSELDEAENQRLELQCDLDFAEESLRAARKALAEVEQERDHLRATQNVRWDLEP